MIIYDYKNSNKIHKYNGFQPFFYNLIFDKDLAHHNHILDHSQDKDILQLWDHLFQFFYKP